MEVKSNKQVVPAILITGASTGIGETCARRMAKLGYTVYAGVRRSEDARRLSRESERIVPIILDVTNASQIAAAAAQVSREVNGNGGLLGIVNNAGIALAGPLEFLPIDEFRRQMEINVTGLLAVTQAFMPLLRHSQGRIVHIGSNSGKVSTPFTGAYCASKHAVEALTDAMRVEFHGTGIQVALIQPGAIATPIWEKSTAHAEDVLAKLPPQAEQYYGKAFEALRAGIGEITKRAASPELVADAVEHALLATTPRTRYVVGLDAKLQLAVARFLPDRVMDWALRKVIGLP